MRRFDPCSGFRRFAPLLALFGVIALPVTGAAGEADHVLVVANGASADSIRIAEHYARMRRVPPEQILRLEGLPADPPDGIDRTLFDRAIHAPVAAWLTRYRAQDRIHFMVLAKGIPLRINGGGNDTKSASVDSELTLLYRRMTGAEVPLDGPAPNPYFLGTREITEAKRFSRDAFDIYLVTRLDGYTVDDVIGLIDRAAAPSSTGRFVLDGKFAWTDKGNVWLRAAAERLKAAGLAADRVIADASPQVISDQVDVLGYYSWGSNDPAIRRRSFNLEFRPGAIGGMFVSTDGRTFREPPAEWAVGNWTDRRTWFAGSPQSLVGDLIRAGITGVAGHVSEPYLGNTIRPDILFPAYVAGFSLAEAFYLAMPSLSWQTVVVGDPLCRPFQPSRPMAPSDETIDPETELPSTFSRRRLEALSTGKVPLGTLELVLRAESRLARDDRAGAMADLEHATAATPTLVAAQHTLAAMYEAEGQYDAAIARYRAILDMSPDDPLALNNLAFALAVRKGSPSDALPFAQRARALAPRSGAIADTLGWIQHLLGNDDEALPLLVDAVTLGPHEAEIHLHLAVVHAARGDREAALASLARALELDKNLADSAAARALQAR